MSYSWTEVTLEDAMASIIDYRGKTPTKTSSGIPLVTAKIIKNGRIEEPKEFISPDDYDTWMRRGIPQPGDVVITTEAPLGEVAQLGERKVALAQRVITLRGKEELLNNTYLRYLLQGKAMQDALRARSSGTTVVGIKQKELRKIMLKLPPLAVQVDVASILKSFDNKIELNRKLNHTQEAIARAFFQSWFIDFDPVKAKQAALGLGYDPERAAMAALSGKLTVPKDPDDMSTSWLEEGESRLSELRAEQREQLKQTASLFPDRLVESELGLIPEGWEVLAFSQLCEINPKRTLKKGTLSTYLDMKSVPTSGPSPVGTIMRAFTSGTKFINGDTLLARITPCLENGKTAYVDFLDEDEVAWGSTEFIIIRPKQGVPTSIGYFLARSNRLRTHAIQSMTGTSGRQRVPVSSFDQYFVPSPSTLDIYNEFGKFSALTLRKIRASSAESKRLALLRDTLLPKLLAGELSRSHIEPTLA